MPEGVAPHVCGAVPGPMLGEEDESGEGLGPKASWLRGRQLRVPAAERSFQPLSQGAQRVFRGRHGAGVATKSLALHVRTLEINGK